MSGNPTLLEALDDVEARFLYNLPMSELNQTDRLFFQIEQAYWYYEDFKADKYNNLPHFSNLKKFAEKIFSHCPLLMKMEDKFQELFSTFSAYKSKIPVFGCIILNPKMNKWLLVCDYNSKSWMLPRGKINQNESEYQCAIREVYEEIGFDPSPYCREEDNLEIYQDGKMVKLFIATNVPESTVFSTQTRKEISQIEFHPIDAVPKNSYGVLPFVPKIKRWISKYGRRAGRSQSRSKSALKSPAVHSIKSPIPHTLLVNSMKTANAATASGKKRATASNSSISTGGGNNSEKKHLVSHPSPSIMKRLRNVFDQRNTDTFSQSESSQGWGVHDMFAANSKITGLDYKYNGNPHEFGSSHPRFVDYRSVTPSSSSSRSVLGVAGSAEESLLELHELSQQSLRGHSIMRKERGKDNDEGGAGHVILEEHHRLPPAFALPRSAFDGVVTASMEPYKWRSAKFSFSFDKADVMSAVDAVLFATQGMY